MVGILISRTGSRIGGYIIGAICSFVVLTCSCRLPEEVVVERRGSLELFLDLFCCKQFLAMAKYHIQRGQHTDNQPASP